MRVERIELVPNVFDSQTSRVVLVEAPSSLPTSPSFTEGISCGWVLWGRGPAFTAPSPGLPVPRFGRRRLHGTEEALAALPRGSESPPGTQ